MVITTTTTRTLNGGGGITFEMDYGPLGVITMWRCKNITSQNAWMKIAQVNSQGVESTIQVQEQTFGPGTQEMIAIDGFTWTANPNRTPGNGGMAIYTRAPA